MARVAIPRSAPTTVPDEVLAADLTDAHLNELDSRYRHRLWGFFRSRGFDDFEADDLTQEVLIVLVTGGAATFDPSRVSRHGQPVRFSAWLFRIAYRKAADAWRERGRSPCQFSNLPAAGGTVTADPADWKPAPETEQAALLATKDLGEALASCRGLLDEREALVLDLWLRSEGTMKLRELAEVLEVHSTTVPFRLQLRAFHKLQDCLSGKGYTDYGAA